MRKNNRILVVGRAGVARTALAHRLEREGYYHLQTPADAELDLTDARAVEGCFGEFQPEYVFLLPGDAGGIAEQEKRPADCLHAQLAAAANVLAAASRHGVKKLECFGAPSVYPRLAPQPVEESALLTGDLDPRSEPDGLAKITALRLAQAYRRQYGLHTICVVPASIYGPGSSFDPETAHVIPALLSRFEHAVRTRAPAVTVWGTGLARREFLHADDFADAALFLMLHYNDAGILNAGSGEEVRIRELAHLVAGITGYTGQILFDRSRPEGAPRKLLDSSRLRALGWKSHVCLADGIRSVYREWMANRAADEAA